MNQSSLILKDKLIKKQATLGSWITMGNPAIAEILARAGFDWLVVDLEHSTMSLESAGELIRVIDLCGVTPLVRLTSNQPDQIKRVMDAGAHGVVVPMVNSRAEAERAVAAVHYAPKGNRSVGLARAQRYGPGFQDYLEWQKGGPIVIVQVEHRDAVERLDDLLTVPGVDGFIVGPYDLSCSLGIPGQFEHSVFLSAMEQIRSAAQRLSVVSGLHVVEPDNDRLAQALREGYRFIAYSVDFRLLDVGVRSGLNRFRELMV
jgi:2-dehydro-3-deoxyglucarate aldolase